VGQSVTITADLGDLGDPAYPVTVSSSAINECSGIASVTPLTSGSFPSTRS
jgi:hypothetical protein